MEQECIADEMALAERQETALQTEALSRLTREQIDLVKDTIAKGATDTELRMFIEECNSLGLNPFAKEIYFLKYRTRDGNASVAMPIGIDGRRKFADRHPLYRGQAGPYWCGPDGVWRDVWLENGPPAACKVGIYLDGYPEPTWGVVTWREFNRVGRAGDQFWKSSPAHMLAIRAESHALRKVATQLPAPRPVVTPEYLASQVERIQRDTALPSRTPPPSDEEVRRQVFGDEDVDEETGEILDDDTVDGECEPVEETPPPAFLDDEANRAAVLDYLVGRGVADNVAAEEVARWRQLGLSRQQVQGAAKAVAASAAPQPVVDWDTLKLSIMRRKLPVRFRDLFLALAQASGWSQEQTMAQLGVWQTRYQEDADQALADMADMARMPDEGEASEG